MRARGGAPLRGRGLPQVGMAAAAVPLVPGDRVAGDHADLPVQGHRDPRRLRRRRRQPRLRQHAVCPLARVLRGAGVAVDARLGGSARPALRHGQEDARSNRRSVRERCRPPVPGPGDGDGSRVPPPHRGRVLRRGRQDGGRPLLRRRGARALRLHPLWRLHGGLSLQRQEHAAEELSVVRREAGRRHPGRAPRRRRTAARGRGRVGGLRGRGTALGNADPAPARDADREGRRVLGRCRRHELAAAALQALRLAA